jgi:hypothetical protein
VSNSSSSADSRERAPETAPETTSDARSLLRPDPANRARPPRPARSPDRKASDDRQQRAAGVVEDLLAQPTHASGGAETRSGKSARRILKEALEQAKAGGENEGDSGESDQDRSGIVSQLLQQGDRQP